MRLKCQLRVMGGVTEDTGGSRRMYEMVILGSGKVNSEENSDSFARQY